MCTWSPHRKTASAMCPCFSPTPNVPCPRSLRWVSQYNTRKKARSAPPVQTSAIVNNPSPMRKWNFFKKNAISMHDLIHICIIPSPKLTQALQKWWFEDFPFAAKRPILTGDMFVLGSFLFVKTHEMSFVETVKKLSRDPGHEETVSCQGPVKTALGQF